MIDPETTERLIAYHDGEMTSTERTDLEQLMARDEQARQFLAEMKRNDEMIALADTIDVPEGYWDSFNERLMGRILRREARRKADRHERAGGGSVSRGWRRWFGPLQMAAAVVLAATVALQVGVHLGDSRPAGPGGTDVIGVSGGPSYGGQDSRTFPPAARPGTAGIDVPGNPARLYMAKDGLHREPVKALNLTELNGILMSTEDVLTTLANGNIARPEELQAYQVILVNTGLLRQIDAARNSAPSEARVLYVLNNSYDVLNRAANAEPAKAKVIAASLQDDVNNLGLLEATQGLIRDNRILVERSRKANAK